MKSNQNGYVDLELVGALFILGFVVLLFFAMFFVRFTASNGVTSGIVYNTSNNNALSGSTSFSVRASVDTYVSEENRSSYCLPKGSPYIALINKAAQDKRIKVVVESHKYFAVQAPWTCAANVTVKEVE